LASQNNFPLPSRDGKLRIVAMNKKGRHIPAPQETTEAAHHQAFPTEHRRALLPEKYFNWRAGEITRLEAFCDVVFGFAITLLVVSLEVPHNYAELLDDMRGFLPFAICFAQLIMIWRTHYRFSRRYGLEDPYTVFLNVVLLFLVLFYVYPLKFVFTLIVGQLMGGVGHAPLDAHQASVLMRIYGAGFAAVFLLVFLMYLHAYRLRREIGLDELEILETRVSMQESAILASVGVASFVVAIHYPEWAGWIYFLLGPALSVHGTVFGKRTRRMAEAMGRG
jgi:uncharacterized membrane protein